MSQFGRLFLLILVVLVAPLAIDHPRVDATQIRTERAHITYTPSSENFPNPERGFWHGLAPFYLGTERNPVDATFLRTYRDEGISVVRLYYVIDEFRQVPLPPSFLDAFTSDFAAVRTAGLKAIPRFTYSFPCADALEPCSPETYGVTDTALDIVLGHVSQLAPVLRDNADVIATVEMGFIGAWGEWHDSSSDLLSNHIVNGNSLAIVNAVLDALPVTRTAVLRYPYHKVAIFGPVPLDPDEAFSGSPKSRVGAHNDCFLSNEHDGGTYWTPYPPFGVLTEWFTQYLNLDNRFVPQTGETCSAGPDAQAYVPCPNTLAALSTMRWSMLNVDYQPQVIALWKQQGCFDEIAGRLGYRFRLVSADVPGAAFPGSTLQFALTLHNDGFASPFNPRAVELVLRQQGTAVETRIPLPTDPRFWTGGTTQELSLSAAMPANMAPGTYDVFLNLPDPEPTLRSRPEYSIRFANAGVWEAATGYNSLLTTIDVASAAPSNVTLQPAGIVGNTVTLQWADPSPGSVLEYVLEAGTASGLADVFNAPVGTSTSLTAAVPSGAYYVRIRARRASGLGSPSNEIAFQVRPPGLPEVILQQPMVNGNTVTLQWNQSTSGMVLDYLLQAGSTGGASDIFNAFVGAGTSLAAAVPNGTYYVRVRARGPGGLGPPSNEVIVLVGTTPCVMPPLTPLGLAGQVAGGTASVLWQAAPGALSYTVQAGSSPGGLDLFNGNVGAVTAVSAPVGPGFRAYVRVFAANPCGISSPSSEILIQ